MWKGLPDLSRETNCLDDDFTAEELRTIASSMGELKARLERYSIKNSDGIEKAGFKKRENLNP